MEWITQYLRDQQGYRTMAEYLSTYPSGTEDRSTILYAMEGVFEDHTSPLGEWDHEQVGLHLRTCNTCQDGAPHASPKGGRTLHTQTGSRPKGGRVPNTQHADAEHAFRERLVQQHSSLGNPRWRQRDLQHISHTAIQNTKYRGRNREYAIQGTRTKNARLEIRYATHG